MRKIIGLIILILWGSAMLTGCTAKNTPKFLKETRADFKFKQVTPKMELEMASLMEQGCQGGPELLNEDTAQMYSLIPGGGQFYTGEGVKGLYYLVSSVLVVPYFASFRDAQNSVDYFNFQHDIEYCREKVRLASQLKNRERKADLFK